MNEESAKILDEAICDLSAEIDATIKLRRENMVSGPAWADSVAYVDGLIKARSILIDRRFKVKNV